MKKFWKVTLVCVIAAAIAVCFAGCNGDAKYYENMTAYAFWENEAHQAISQPNIGRMVRDFLDAPLEAGKTVKKVAFIGYDGCREDVVAQEVFDPAGKPIDPSKSAIGTVIDKGGHIYLAYSGGNKGGENEQHPSTAPGWAALLTGEWGIKNGITDNGMLKNLDYKTFLLDYAEKKGMKSSFAASWEAHFTENYTKEVDHVYLRGNNIPMVFRHVEDDEELHTYLKSCLTAGSPDERDLTFGIYEATDHAGHAVGFGAHVPEYAAGFRTEDRLAKELLDVIYARPGYDTEEWLIVITTDHGGIQTWHGGQTLEERNTWVVSNRPVDSKFYAENYDGYKEK